MAINSIHLQNLEMKGESEWKKNCHEINSLLLLSLEEDELEEWAFLHVIEDSSS